MSEHMVSDGIKEVTADELEAGNLYSLVKDGGKEHLRRLPPRETNQLAVLRIEEEAMIKLKALLQSTRANFGGHWHPDISLAGTALLLKAIEEEDAIDVIIEYGAAKFDAARERKKEQRARENGNVKSIV